MKYRCIPCNHEFEAPGGKKPRCPRCLNIHDVEPVKEVDGAATGKKRPNWVPAVILLSAVGIAAAYYLSKKSDAPKDAADAATDSKDIFETLDIPKNEAVDPCAVTPEIEAFAKKTVDGAEDADALEALYKALLQRKEAGQWRPYHQREPREGRPLAAGKFLKALDNAGDKPVQALSYELACLMLASAKSREVDASMVEILSYQNEKSPADPEGKFGRFGVVTGTGEAAKTGVLFDPWGKRAKDGAKADTVVLTERQAMAPYFAIGALSLLVKQEMSEALALNDIAVKLDPKNPYYRSGRGFIFAATGVPSESLVEFEKALKYRSDPVQRVNLAEILLLVNPMDKRAESEVMSALADMPDYARAHAVLGVIHLMRGEKDLAETELGKAERLDPKSPSIAMYWARFHAATMDSEAAVAKAEEAVRLSDRSVSSLLGLAGIYREVTEFSKMRAVLDEVYTKIPSPTMAEQIKGIFGYDPAPEDAVAENDDADTEGPSGTDDSQFELKLGGGLGKGPALGGGSGLSLDTPGGGLGGGDLGGKGGDTPGLGGDLKLDMKMNP